MLAKWRLFYHTPYTPTLNTVLNPKSRKRRKYTKNKIKKSLAHKTITTYEIPYQNLFTNEKREIGPKH